MNKRNYFLSIFVFILLTFFNVNAVTFVSPNANTKTAINLLEKLPEYNRLIQEVEAKGPITIEMVSLPNEKFDAFWNSANRTIRINTLKNQDINVLVSSILFELHNAKSDALFKSLYTSAMRGEISKEAYVENVERMEHQNALNCSILLDKGIQLGIFSQKAAWPIFKDFDDHYKLQQIREHSQWIAKTYEQMAPRQLAKVVYIGTINLNLSTQDKEDLVRYLKIKNDLESVSESQNLRGIVTLKKEYQDLENCYLGNSKVGCARAHERLVLLDYVLQNNETFKEITKNSNAYTAMSKTFRPSHP